MSNYTINIWLCALPEQMPRLPQLSDAVATISEPRAFEMHELPARVLLSAPGIRYLLTLGAEGELSGAARASLRRYAASLAEELGGATEEDGILTPTRTFDIAAINLYTEMATLALWYEPKKAFSAISDAVLSTLETFFPAALPIDDEWNTAHPIAAVLISDAAEGKCEREGYRASRFAIEFPVSVYSIPEYSLALRRLLRELCDAADAFFGQITLTECPVSAWWWQGIPDELGVACYFGAPYASLIPDCERIGTPTKKGFFFEEPNGPRVPDELLSFKKSKLKLKNTDYPYYDNFTVAKNIPLVN